MTFFPKHKRITSPKNLITELGRDPAHAKINTFIYTLKKIYNVSSDISLACKLTVSGLWQKNVVEEF